MENNGRERRCKCMEKGKDKKTKVVMKRPSVWKDEVMQIKAKNKVSFKDALLLASQRRRSLG